MAVDERLINLGYAGATGGRYTINDAGAVDDRGHFVNGGFLRTFGNLDVSEDFVGPVTGGDTALFFFLDSSNHTLLYNGGSFQGQDNHFVDSGTALWHRKAYTSDSLSYERDDITGAGIGWSLDLSVAPWYCSIPIFDNWQAVYNYIVNGDYSGALNFDVIQPEDERVKCDFVLHHSSEYANINMLSLSWTPSEGLEKMFSNGDHSIEMCWGSMANGELLAEMIQIPSRPLSEESISWKNFKWIDNGLSGLYQILYKDLFYQLKGHEEYDESEYMGICVRVRYTDNDGNTAYTNNVYGTFRYYDFDYKIDCTAADGSTMRDRYGAPDEDDSYIDPSPDTDDIPDGDGYSTIGLLTNTYLMTDAQTRAFGNEIWSDSFFENIKLLNSSPIENILSVKYFPMTLGAIGNDVVKLGNVELNCYGHKVDSTMQVKFTIGSKEVPEVYRSFIDYAQTGVSINLPFAGVFELPTAAVMGKTLKVELIIDPLTGAGKYILYCNGVQFASYSAAVGIDMPITASNRAQVEASVISSLSKTLIDTATENYMGAVMDVAGMVGIQNHSNTSGSSAPACSCYESKHVFLIIDRPNGNIDYSKYGHAVGYKCNLSKTISKLNGYTECINVDTSNIPFASDYEREQIKSIMEGGFYA